MAVFPLRGRTASCPSQVPMPEVHSCPVQWDLVRSCHLVHCTLGHCQLQEKNCQCIGFMLGYQDFSCHSKKDLLSLWCVSSYSFFPHTSFLKYCTFPFKVTQSTYDRTAVLFYPGENRENRPRWKVKVVYKSAIAICNLRKW